MRSLLVHLLVFSLVFGFPGALTAGDYSWIGQGGEKKWQSHAEFTGRAATNSVYGLEVSPFVPIAQNENSLWFLNVRNNMFWEHGDFGHEFNIGGGYRRVMGDNTDGWILGAYGFFDRLDSRYDNHFNQGTLGLEAMWVNWDLRANGYIASDDEKLASDAQNAQAMFSGGTVVVKSGVEQAMSGFDAELGWRLPFALDSALGDTRVYAGGFWFDNDLDNSIGGPKLRAEMRVHDVPGLWEGSRLTVSTSWRWDDERGSDLAGMIGLRIPIGAPTRTQPLTHLERRMTDSVVRDVFIVSTTGLGDAESARTSTGAVIGDTLFFDESTNGVGTEADPGEVGAMIAAGGENALLIGLDTTGVVEVDNETLMDGQTVAGGGSELIVFGADSGQMATVRLPGEHSAVINNDDTTAFHLAENNTIAGLFFAQDIDRALELELDNQSTMLELYQNTFFGLNTALEVDVENDSSLTLWLDGNLFESVGTGVDLWASDSFDVHVKAHDNRFHNNSPFGPFGPVGMELTLAPDGGPSGNPSTFTLDVYDNEFGGNYGLDYGIQTTVMVSGDEDFTHTSRIVGNTFHNSYYDDYDLAVYGSSPDGDVVIDVELRDNIFEDANSHAVDIYIDPIPYGSVDISITGNDIEDVDGDAIQIDLYGAPDTNIAITDNQIVDVDDGGDAIDIDLYSVGSSSGNTIDVSRNLISEVDDGGDGIEIDVDFSYDTTVTANDNTVREISDGDGIDINLYDTGHDSGNDVTVTGNTIDDVSDRGIDVYFGYGFDATATVSNNTVRDTDDGDGIEIDFRFNGHDSGNTAVVDNNTVNDTDGDGIDVGFSYGYDGTATVTNNTISNTDSDGIRVNFYLSGHDSGNSATIDGNVVSDVTDDGIDLYFGYGYDATASITNNTISDANDGDGIELDFRFNGHDSGDSATITGNTISNTDGAGIDVYFGYGYDGTVTIADNTISDSTDGDGIEVDFYLTGHSDGNSADINNNTITNVNDDGIDVYSGFSYDLDLRIADNVIEDAEGDGIRTSVYFNGQVDGPGTDVRITGNSVTQVDDDGIDVYFGYSYDGTLTISNNTITDTGLEGGGDGIEVDFYFNGNDVGNVATISNNTVEGVHGGDGIEFDARYSYDTSVTISDNTITDTDDDGIDVYFGYNGHDLGNSAWISGNTVTDSEDDGIDVYFRYSLDSEATIFENTVTDARGDGVEVDVYRNGGGDGTSVVVASNTISGSRDDGIDVFFDYNNYSTYGPSLTVADNEISGSGDHGIQVGVAYQYYGEFVITDNEVSDSGDDGIQVAAYIYADYNTFEVTHNNVRDSGDGIDTYDPYSPFYGDHGIYALFGYSADDNDLEIGGNSVTDSDDYGIYVYSYESSTTLTSDGADNSVIGTGDGDAGFGGGPFTGTISVNGVEVP